MSLLKHGPQRLSDYTWNQTGTTCTQWTQWNQVLPLRTLESPAPSGPPASTWNQCTHLHSMDPLNPSGSIYRQVAPFWNQTESMTQTMP